MSQNSNSNQKIYDLEERTSKFSQLIIQYLKNLPKNLVNMELCKQLFRSGCSVGANYIEANESLGRKDFIMRIKICRKESKESRHWLKLSQTDQLDVGVLELRQKLIEETNQLMKIFGSILEKCK